MGRGHRIPFSHPTGFLYTENPNTHHARGGGSIEAHAYTSSSVKQVADTRVLYVMAI